MATVLVYVQRTPRGLHPASVTALCVARDLGSQRGAAVVALCSGDGGEFDRHIERACGRYGADQLFFIGPQGLANTVARLQAAHVLTGWTREGIQTLGKAGLGPIETRHVNGPFPVEEIPAVLGVLAGSLPWYDFPTTIEGDYEGDVGDITMPPWLSQGDGSLQHGGAGLVYVAPEGLGPAIPQALESLGAHAVPPEYAASHSKGTLLWLSADGQGLPTELASRPPGARVVAMPGPDPQMHDTWNLADWVLPGSWSQVIAALSSPAWKANLG